MSEEYDGDDADTEISEEEEDKPAAKGTGSVISVAGMPDEPGWPERRKDRGRRMKERWEMKRCNYKKATESDQCRLIVRPNGQDSVCICMDMMEVKACRDLGLDLPCDWTVEIPGIDVVESSSGSNSPIANWTISSPGDDPKEVKARLKVWAHAVALASASHLTSPTN